MSKHRYKFQNLDVYKLGLQYLENVYEPTSSFPDQLLVKTGDGRQTTGAKRP